MLSEEHVLLIEVGRNILTALELHKRASPFPTIILPPQDEDLHVNKRSREQISYVRDQRESKCEMNYGRGNYGCKNQGEAFHWIFSVDMFTQ